MNNLIWQLVYPPLLENAHLAGIQWQGQQDGREAAARDWEALINCDKEPSLTSLYSEGHEQRKEILPPQECKVYAAGYRSGYLAHLIEEDTGWEEQLLTLFENFLTYGE